MTLLTVNDDVTIPGVVVCLHVETLATPDKINPARFHHTLRCWSAVAGRIEDYKWTREKQSHGSCATQLWDWVNFVRLIHRPTWLFLCNAALGLTATGWWSLLESGEFSLHRRPSKEQIAYRRRRKDKKPERVESGLLITSGPPDVVVAYHRTGWKIIIIDSANYLSSTNAGSVTGNPSPAPCAPSQNAPLANWLKHSTDSAASLKCQLSDLICWHKAQELGRFPFSVAGMALAAFRHRFMHIQPDCPDDLSDRDIERAGYYPGRMETFWCGKVDAGGFTPLAHYERQAEWWGDWPSGPFFHVDARSFYGAVGAFCELPYKHLESSPDSVCCTAPGSGRIVEYLARVELATGDSVYPVRHAGRVLYARGHYRTILCGPELNRAYQRGHIVRWLWWRRYALEMVFRPFCEAMWAQRRIHEERGNLTLARVCKSLLARLHGKFMQRTNKWEARPDMIAPYPWAEWGVSSTTSGAHRKFRAVGWDVEEETEGGDAPQCFPALAAWVTSWGREWLNTWIQIAGQRNVLYVNTDSLIVTREGKERLEKRGIIYPEGIGSCRITDVTDDIEIKAPNNFRFGSRRVRSGRSEARNGIEAPVNSTVVADTLRSVLYAHHGADYTTTVLPFTDQPCTPYQKMTGGGWLLPPEVNTCSDNSRSPLLTCPAS